MKLSIKIKKKEQLKRYFRIHVKDCQTEGV